MFVIMIGIFLRTLFLYIQLKPYLSSQWSLLMGFFTMLLLNQLSMTSYLQWSYLVTTDSKEVSY